MSRLVTIYQYIYIYILIFGQGPGPTRADPDPGQPLRVRASKIYRSWPGPAHGQSKEGKVLGSLNTVHIYKICENLWIEQRIFTLKISFI